MNKYNLVLKQVLEKIKPSKDEIEEFEKYIKKFLKDFKLRFDKNKIDAKIFLGGSFAKNTLIKKDVYDVDVFIRFNKKYSTENISKLIGDLIKDFEDVQLMHGSRDYFRIRVKDNFFVELIPVIKIKNPEEAENITDLSYSHVKYITKNVKGNLLDEVRLSKAFCYANHCYGAESYIRGFSGYSLELLTYYYGSFLKFIQAMVKVKDVLVIDIEKHYKTKKNVLMDLNSSKLQSPVILVDPTNKRRNVLAALSNETFERFKKECKQFLDNPSLTDFEIKKTDLERIKKDALKKENEFILLEAKTMKQEGDIAGSKLLKFYNHLTKEIQKYFDVKDKGFNYNKKQSARYFFVVKRKEEILIQGPPLSDESNLKKFQKKHLNYFMKEGKIYSKEIIDFSLKEFIQHWKDENRKKINEMAVDKLEIIDY